MITVSETYTQPSTSRNTSGNSATARFRALVHRIRAISESSEVSLSSIGLTSCSLGEGVSSMAANFAVAAAEVLHHPVLLIDLNVASPAQASLFGLSGNLGLRDALCATAAFSDCPKPTSIANLSLLAPSAAYEIDPSSIDPLHVREMLDAYQNDYELIVVDLPPATEASPAVQAAASLSGVLLVIEAERTRCEVAERTVNRLSSARANVLGVVLNKRPEHIPNWLYKRL